MTDCPHTTTARVRAQGGYDEERREDPPTGDREPDEDEAYDRARDDISHEDWIAGERP